MPVRQVAIVIHDGVQALDVAGPLDVFAEANAFVAVEDRYETLLVAEGHAPLRASSGLRMVPDLSFAEADGAYAMVLVAGGPALPTAAPDAASASGRPARSTELPSATGAMKPTERSAAARMTDGAIDVCSSAAMTPVSLTASAANWSERCSI